MWKMGILLSVLLIAALSACEPKEDSMAKISGKAVSCDKPFILIDESCCLDKNENLICDDYEADPYVDKGDKKVYLPESPSLEQPPVVVKKDGQQLIQERKLRADREVKYSSYTNPSYKIRMDYPSGWSIRQNKKNLITFVSMLDSTYDPFRENVNILIQDLPAQLNIQQYRQVSLDQIKELIDNVTFIDIRRTQLIGSPADKIVYRGMWGDIELKFMQMYTLKGGKAYILTYSAAYDDYDTRLPIVLNMFKSFEKY